MALKNDSTEDVPGSTVAASQREPPSISQKMSEKHIRVAVIGNVDAGKSSLIGTLKSGQLDDGRGLSRSSIMIHKHEIETGRTSVIASHLLGYDEDCNPIITNKAHKSKASACTNHEDVASRAHSFVTLVDLAGHERYLKTTIHGISSGMIDYALVLVNSKNPPTHMTCHHINLAISYGIPIILVLTKADDCPAHVMKSTKQELIHLLRSSAVQQRPYEIRKQSDIAIATNNMSSIAPIITTSCVTGEGLELLNKLLATLPKRRRHQNKIGRDFEFLIETVFNVTGVGPVVSGFVNAGKIKVGDKVFVGPVDDGTFIPTIVKSSHIERANVSTIVAGNSACMALSLSKTQKKLLRGGMVVLESQADASIAFEAEMAVLRGSGIDGTTIRCGYETYVHVLHMKQSARVEKIELIHDSSQQQHHCSPSEIVARAGNRARITFRFLQRKEFIRTGMKVMIRDGHVRGCGLITKVYNDGWMDGLKNKVWK